MDDKTTEQRINALGLDKPRVEPETINRMMDTVVYVTVQPEGTTSTFCHAYLPGTDGKQFSLATGHSACVVPENFNAQLGIDLAKSKAMAAAKDKLWELMGFMLFMQMNELKDPSMNDTNIRPQCLDMASRLPDMRAEEVVTAAQSYVDFVYGQVSTTKSTGPRTMTEHTNVAEAPAQNEQTGAIQNLDQFAFLIASWFDNNQKQVGMMLQVPDGEEVTVQLEEGAAPEQLVLTGDALKGFKAGPIVAANVFGKLPFGRIEAAPAAANGEAPANETPVATEEELAAAVAAKPTDAPASGS